MFQQTRHKWVSLLGQAHPPDDCFWFFCLFVCLFYGFSLVGFVVRDFIVRDM